MRQYNHSFSEAVSGIVSESQIGLMVSLPYDEICGFKGSHRGKTVIRQDEIEFSGGLRNFLPRDMYSSIRLFSKDDKN